LRIVFGESIPDILFLDVHLAGEGRAYIDV